MKKLIFTIILAFAGIFAHAQVWIGGSLNANINKESKEFSIAPDVGYCIPNTPFSIACAVEYGGEFSKDEGYAHTLTVSPYFRYDVCGIGERFSLFVDLASDIDALKFSYFDIGLAPGISFNLTEHWSAEFSFGFLGYEREKDAEGKIDQDFVLNFETAAPSFGVYYNF